MARNLEVKNQDNRVARNEEDDLNSNNNDKILALVPRTKRHQEK